MRNSVKIFLIILFSLFSNNLFAEDKIVVLDLKYVLNESKAGKSAQDYLKKTYNDNMEKFKQIEEKLKKEEADLLTKKTVLSKEEYTKKSDTLRKKVIDFQSQRRVSLDKIATQRSESRAILIKNVDPILQTYMKENDISIVIDKKTILGGKPETDITKIIVEKLDKVLPSLNLK